MSDRTIDAVTRTLMRDKQFLQTAYRDTSHRYGLGPDFRTREVVRQVLDVAVRVCPGGGHV